MFCRALELAVQYETHVDTVLFHRQQYLQQLGRKEEDAKFQAAAGRVTVDPDAIAAKKQQELEKERSRGTAYKRRMNNSGSSEFKVDPAPVQPARTSYSQPPPGEAQSLRCGVVRRWLR